MVPVKVQTLVVSHAPAPSVVVLLPLEDEPLPGTPEAEATDSSEQPGGHHGNRRIVPIWVGVNEATQLGVALEHARFTRPMTHDLFLDALTNLDACVDHVLIDRVERSTFYSKLVLRQHNRLIVLDARPSDALSLAIRQQAPIYIDELVLERASYPYVFRTRPSAEEEMEEFHKFIADLSPEDFAE